MTVLAIFPSLLPFKIQHPEDQWKVKRTFKTMQRMEAVSTKILMVSSDIFYSICRQTAFMASQAARRSTGCGLPVCAQSKRVELVVCYRLIRNWLMPAMGKDKTKQS
jgi:hypothetical protein